MQFTRVAGHVEDMEVWNASGNDFSFVISHESQDGNGFRGRPGFMASWRGMYHSSSAVAVEGSPFKTLADAESACRAMAILLGSGRATGNRAPRVNFDSAAVLRKWPSLGNERRAERTPYLLVDGTLDECLREFMAKPNTVRHLYEIHVVAGLPPVPAVLPEALVFELAKLRNLL
jgi:hypothetical protein